MTTASGDETKILIIDDDQQVRGVLIRLLGEEYACASAGSAKEALSLLDTGEYDLVISDIVMGGVSGLELAACVSAQSPDTVVVMVSGGQNIDDAIEAMRAGAFDYITKPFDLGHIKAAVERALRHRALLKAKRQHETRLEELVRQRTAELDHLGSHDAVTGLPNRVLYTDRLVQSLSLAQRQGHRLATLAVSFDNFKKINDTWGHAAGDQLLREVGERLTDCVAEGDTVARLDGDEFAALIALPNGESAVGEVVRRICESLNGHLTLDGKEVFITSSVGISLYPENGDDAQALLKHASAALFRARQKGGDSYQFYTAEMSAESLSRLTLENELRRAVEGGEELCVFYQPQWDVSTRRVVGMEALVRWQHPVHGLVEPADFIPLAEELGLVVALGERVLYTACRQAVAWRQAWGVPLRLAVNVSSSQFQQQNLPVDVSRVLHETGLDPSLLELELTENSIMKNPPGAARTLGLLKQMGVGVAIDDFGTGYSSLSYLRSLPLDTLKIDRSFISEVTNDPDDAAIVMSVITLAHNLGLTVLAEGVETEEQLKLLRLLRCDEAQGYLLSEPLPPEKFESLLLARCDFDPERAASPQDLGGCVNDMSRRPAGGSWVRPGAVRPGACVGVER